MRHCIWISIAVIGGMAAACSKGGTDTAAQPAAPAASQAQAVATAAPALDPQQVFKTRCATCHGDAGRGDGPAAVALTPKPRNYTDADWQKSVTDAQIRQTILYGGAAVGKSPIMPASPDLEVQPEVLDALVKLVRGFAQSG